MRKLPEPPFTAALLLPRWLGDAVMASSLIEPLVRLSGCPVEVWGPAAFRELFSVNRDIASYRVYEGKGRHKGFSGLRRFRREIDTRPPDALLLIPDSMSTALAAKVSGTGIRIGRALEGRGSLLSHPFRSMERNRNRHWVEEKADLLRPFSEPGTLENLEPKISLEEDDKDFERWSSDNGLSTSKYIVYAPGAVFGPAKRWTGFTELSKSFPEDVEILLVGAEADAETIVPLELELREAGRKVTSFVATLSLSSLARLFQNARFTVSNDSGAMHLAAASGARVLGIFLSTDPLWTAPLGPEARFLAASVKCRPCFERKCPLPKMICREAVCTEDVIKSLDDWLETS